MTSPQHIIVTGGSSGIGKAIAAIYLSRGANVTIIARDGAKLGAAREELLSQGGVAGANVLALSADVADRTAIVAAILKAIEEFGTPALLVNSAGIARPGYFEELPVDSFHEQMSVNYFGTLNATRAVLPSMRTAGRGRIVFVASGAALIGVFGYTAYGASKFALRGFAEALRSELRPSGIGVSVAYPPDTDTPQLHEENLVKPRETKIISGSAQTWTAQDVAKTIVAGVDSGRFAITPGWEMTILNWTHSFLRPMLNWHFDRLIAGKAREKGTESDTDAPPPAGPLTGR
jgi:3-dehydrosphinganine reductase